MHIYRKKYHGDISDMLPAPSQAPFGLSQPRTKSASAIGLTQPPELKSGTLSLPSLTYRVLNKMAFGASDADYAHINNLSGGAEMDRVLAYIDEQLAPENIDDSYCDSLLTQGFETLNKSRQQLYQEHLHRPDGSEIEWDYHIKPGTETTQAAFLRARHSKRQLFEMMVDFWHNHFNVYMDTDGVQPMFVHYDRDVIRPEALGNFRNMMYEVTRSNCMLQYLGNGVNEQSAPNENFARELLELHTISAKNYFGHMDPNDVPVDNEGRKTAYVEADVLEMARALTGWSFSGAAWQDFAYLYNPPIDYSQAPTGTFLFRSDWHDQGVKSIMGMDFYYDSNNPQKDMNDVFDMLAEHPLTADFLARKLCQRFIADTPPQSIIDQVADSLHNNWQAPDQIKQAMEVLLKSSEFLNTWGEKIKRPFERTIAAMRQIDYDFDFNPTNQQTANHFWAFTQTGQVPFRWTSPNGYPDTKSHWLSASSMMATWRYIQWFSRLRDGSNDETIGNIIDITANALSVNERTANGMVNFWYQKICGVAPDPDTFNKLADFMSYDDINEPIAGSRDEPIDIYAENWPDYPQERLLALVGTILISTSFIYR